MEQLELFNDKPIVKNGKLTTTYEINLYNIVGIYSDMQDVHGFDKLNEIEQEYLTFLYRNYNTPLSGFANKSELTKMFKTTERNIRTWNEHIHKYTHLVVWSSTKYGGTKLASNSEEIDNAIEDRKSHVDGAIRNIMYMAKNKDLDHLHSTVGYYKREIDNKPNGQVVMTFNDGDEENKFYVINHYPDNQDKDHEISHQDRIKLFNKQRHAIREYINLLKSRPLGMSYTEYETKLIYLESEVNKYLDIDDMPQIDERVKYYKENKSR